jgi:DNA-binding MurR/RpiR family transcriptional regulator
MKKNIRSLNKQLHLLDTLKNKILAAYQLLPKNQRRIADYLLSHGNDSGLHTTESLAKELRTSKASIVRFCQSIGYKGYIELRTEMLEALRSGINALDTLVLTLGKHSSDETLSLVAKHELANINTTIQQLDRKVFNDAVNMLMKAERVMTMGIGVSSLLAEIFAYELTQVSIDARALSSSRVRFVESLVQATPKDVIVAFSFPPYSKETVEAAIYVHSKAIPLIAFTNRLTAPIAYPASIVIPVRSENMLYTNSISALSVVINAIVTEIATKKKNTVAKSFEEMTKILDETSQYVQ